MTSAHIAQNLFRDREDFRSFHGREEQSYLVVGALYAALLAAVALAAWAVAQDRLLISIPCSIAAFLVIGWAQYSLGNGLHEAVHHNLRNRKSDRLPALITAYPIGLTMGYRRVHLLHHRYLGTDRDPDRPAYIDFPRTKGRLALRLLWNASGIPALVQFFELMTQPGPSDAKQSAGREIVWFALVQLVVFGVFWLIFGNPIYYFVFWAAPIATIGKVLSSTRLLCEHGSSRGGDDWVVRTIDGSRWQTWVMGAFDFNYHAEHHLFPSVPYAHLERLHRRLRAYHEANPEFRPLDGRFEMFHGGYLMLLAHWFRILPWRASAMA